jgi:hypothetical protein
VIKIYLICYYEPPFALSTCECSDMRIYQAYPSKESAESALQYINKENYPDAFVTECDFIA